jgi:hypothetical protein
MLNSEEFSREGLVRRILKWSRQDDAEAVLREVKAFALALEKHIQTPASPSVQTEVK